jgi:hypothetical protein
MNIKKYFIILFVIGIISSTTASVNAWEDDIKELSVYNNQGSVGIVHLVNTDGSYNTADDFKVQAWSTINLNLTGRHDIRRIAFRTEGRHECYNANLYWVSDWTDNYCYRNVNHLDLIVDFFPDKMYMNRFSVGAPFNTGWGRNWEFSGIECEIW